MLSSGPSAYPRIYAVVARVPRGRVATYGQIARLAGMPNHARLVGYALHGLPDSLAVPWHRIVNARGEISVRSGGLAHDRLQRVILEREGVRFDRRDRIALAVYQWRSRARAPRRPA